MKPHEVARTKEAAAARRAAGLTYPDRMIVIEANRATLPDRPCGRCGARGWCDHRQPA